MRDLADKNYEKTQCYMGIIAAIGRVQDATIAYDVEKVVEELEKEKKIHTENYNISLYRDYPEIKQRYEQIQLVIDDAIAKVRKGGVE